jgi:hypothetical protein
MTKLSLEILWNYQPEEKRNSGLQKTAWSDEMMGAR